ncbi:carboxylate--amine ligase [Allobranchiibius sp. GilTou38]|uniref:carboxylate--amine ligase n=1 Tax=Allobranchiibius sp. GilTou38 TaxID=2815210 RepID=UPI001AA10DDF|nr:carboxylate--amine ligase [Allobranchiibius sp. GilTou38]MBO1768279.1 carboxylate--amine ligase [Allobranchiibius sp. GilTou38]
MPKTPSAADRLLAGQEFAPVVLGGDRLGYSLARSFDLGYGYRTLVVSTMLGGPVAHSSLIDHHIVPSLQDPEGLVTELRALATGIGPEKKLLLATTDHVVSVLARIKHRLEDLYVIPYAEPELIDRLSRKENFADLCAELDIPHPQTVVYDVGERPDLTQAMAALTFPVIAKPSNAEAYAAVTFPGKKKVHSAADAAELRALIDALHGAGYRDKFILQDVIPGDDQGMRLLTCYVDKQGQVKFAAYGRVLLEEHSPETLGIPAAILTGTDHEAVAHATRLLEHVGWRGYANFDMKFDPRTGRTVFFELNPRLGGTSFYITAAGFNTVQLYVDEWVRGQDLSDRPMLEASHEHVFTAIPLRLLQRYVTDPAVRPSFDRAVKAGEVTNPWFYKAERHPRRWAWIAANQANYVRKYREHYPEPKALV